MSLLGDLLLAKTRSAEERQNNINYMQAQGLISAMGKQNPDGSPVLDAEHLSAAQDQLNKLVGTTKEGKGLVQQFGGLVQKLHGHAHQQAGTQGNPQGAGAGAPPPGDAGGGGAAAQGGQAGPSSPAGSSTPLLPPPPTPATPASSAATAPDAAAAMSTPMMPPPPPPGASVGAGNASPAPSPAGAPASPPSPPSFAQIMSRAGTPRSPVPGTPEATAAEVARQTALSDATFAAKDARLQQANVMPGTPEYNEAMFGITPKTAAEVAAGGNIFAKFKKDFHDAFDRDPTDSETDAYFKMNPPVPHTLNVAPGHEITDMKGNVIASKPPLPRAPSRAPDAKNPAAKAAADAQKAAIAAQKEYESELDKFNKWHTDHYLIRNVQDNPYTQSLAEKKDKLAKARRVAAAGASGLTPPPASATPTASPVQPVRKITIN